MAVEAFTLGDCRMRTIDKGLLFMEVLISCGSKSKIRDIMKKRNKREKRMTRRKLYHNEDRVSRRKKWINMKNFREGAIT